MNSNWKLLPAALLVAVLAIAGCGGGGGDDSTEPKQTAYEMALDAIQAAETDAAAQAAYDAVDKTAVTGEEADKLMAALTAKQEALATAARITAQKAALATAAAAVDTSDLSDAEAIGTARTAIANLKAALDMAVDVSDDDKSMYQSTFDAANTAVQMAQDTLDTQGRITAQRSAIMSAVTEARTAVDAVNDDSTDAQVMAADSAIAALEAAIDGAADLPTGDPDVASAQGTLATLEGTLAAKKTSRTAAMDKARDADLAVRTATALKLYNGLQHGLGDTDNVRTGASDADGVISVTIGTATAVPLAEDKKTVVAALHGWEGKRHTAEPTGDVGTYEAMVYSNVGDATEGDAFNVAYTLNATTGETGDVTALAGYVTGRVDSPRFDQSAGAKLFKLPTNAVRVVLPGSYHGVSGTYYCTPTSGETCSATIAESGFTLGGGTWSFKPTTATAKVMSVADTVYASYGWWLNKSEDDGTYTASAFATARGTVTAATGIDTLRGTATYEGGAAGKYALHSSTGGTNDAGHFTATATLEADFNADMVSGTIDDFMGADGESRDWSVELKKSGVGAGGAITGSDGTGDPMETVWTIDGTAAPAAGQWSGTLYDNGDDGVPKVGTGTFHSTHNASGRMVGAFGVNKQ